MPLTSRFPSRMAGLVLATALAFAGTPDARAQDLPVMFDGLAGDLAMSNLLFENTTGRVAAPATRQARPTSAAGASSSLTYSPTPALQQKTLQSYTARLRAQNPAAAQALTTSFGAGKYDYGHVYNGLTKSAGLPANDAASSLTSFMILGWMIVHNVQDAQAITGAMARGVRAQVAPGLARRLPTPTAAAQLGEEMKLQFVVVQGGWQAALREGQLAAYRQGISKLFSTQYGLDLSQLKLTSQGFVKR